MGGKTDLDNLKIKEEIEIFRDEYIFNENKKFTVRTIVNQVKHKHSLKVKELYEPYDFNVNINSTRINLREANLGANYTFKFFELTKPNKVIGNIDIFWRKIQS